MQLTQDQQNAIQHEFGPCLVLAVPGSGKTTVLLHRVKALIDRGHDPKSILSITFSKQQAVDMKRRYQTQFGEQNLPHFSTIHSFCYQILRKYGQMHGTNFHLIESSKEYNKSTIVSRLYRQINHAPISEDALEEFFRIEGYLKNALVDFDTYKKRNGAHVKNFEKISEAYRAFKSERDIIDFDDMLSLTLQILTTYPAILKSLRRRFQFVQVDEGQDTSLIQREIIYKIVHPEDNIFVVADEDQAIYGFRGADPSHLLHFQETYPQAKIYVLKENHRSSKPIVKLSGKLIQINQARYAKESQTENESEEPVSVAMAKDLQTEYDFLQERIPQALAEGTCAVLYRNNISGIPIANFLEREGIPYYAKDGRQTFYRNQIVKDILDIVRFSKDRTDFEAFQRVYYKMNAYIKKTFVEEVSRGNAYEDVLDRLDDLKGTQNKFYREKLRVLRSNLDWIARQPLDRALQAIEDDLGYGTYLQEKAREDNTQTQANTRVLETLHHLAKGLEDDTDLIRRMQELKEAQKKAATAWQPLTISTIHGVKGLEFDTVFLIDLIQNEFPSTTAIQLAKEKDMDLLEEERRLFYVGMTRAKKKLYIIGVNQLHGRAVEPSQFLSELKGRS